METLRLSADEAMTAMKIPEADQVKYAVKFQLVRAWKTFFDQISANRKKMKNDLEKPTGWHDKLFCGLFVSV